MKIFEPERELLSYLSKQKNWKRRKLLRPTHDALPRLVFKYMALDPCNDVNINRIKNVVCRSDLWFSKPSEFNDPFEFRAKLLLNQDPQKMRTYFVKRYMKDLKLTRQKAERLASEVMHNLKQTPSLAQSIFDNIKDEFGVYCLSANARSSLMWSHYANSHKGICLAFSPERDEGTLSLLQKVNYSSTLPSIEFPDHTQRMMGDVILTKSEEWRYEEEFRIFGRRDDSSQTVRISHNALRAIIIGCRATSDHESCIKSIALERASRGLPEVMLYRAKISHSDYRIRFQRM